MHVPQAVGEECFLERGGVPSGVSDCGGSSGHQWGTPWPVALGSLLLLTIPPRAGPRLATLQGLACHGARLIYDWAGLWFDTTAPRATLPPESGRPPESYLLREPPFLTLGGQLPSPRAASTTRPAGSGSSLSAPPSSVTQGGRRPRRGDAGLERWGPSSDRSARAVPASGCTDSPGGGWECLMCSSVFFTMTMGSW